MLGNLAEHGPQLGPSMNSGNFRALLEGGVVCAVFCLTRRGNLLVQTGGRSDLGARIVADCERQPPELSGVVGEFQGASSVWQELLSRPGFRPGLASKEPLYALALGESTPGIASAQLVRRAEPADFERWDALMQAFLREENMPLQGSVEQRRAGFGGSSGAGCCWAGIADGEIVATAVVNAIVDGTGQIGGVYTLPEQRRRGFCRAVMSALIRDSRSLHGLERLVLFTGENNAAARVLYESLGFVQVGDFALFFRKTD